MMFLDRFREINKRGGAGRPRRKYIYMQLLFGLLLAGAFVPAAAVTSTVYVMRHCARATYYPDLEYADQGFQYLQNYTDGGPLPSWGVAPELCTARGVKIVTGQGKSLAAEVKARAGQSKLKVIYDGAAARDKTTSEAFLEGAGLSFKALAKADATIFNPQKAKFCPYPSAEEYRQGIARQLTSVAPPPEMDALFEKLQQALGKGAAPPIPSMNDTISQAGYYLGRTYVASSWSKPRWD